MSYDTQCLALANRFLLDHRSIDTSENASRLAQAIQDVIECEIAAMEDAASVPVISVRIP